MTEVVHLVPRNAGRVRTALCGAKGGATIGDYERRAKGYKLVTSNLKHANCAACLANLAGRKKV